MTDSNKTPVPSLKQFEATVRQLLDERVLSKGGKMPSERVSNAVVRLLANRARRDQIEKGEAANCLGRASDILGGKCEERRK